MSAAPDLDDDFYQAWAAMASRLGVDPLDIARVAFAETGMFPHDPRGVDKRTNAGGLFPFMPSTLRGLGWQGSPEEFRAQTAAEQASWVERYLRPYAPYLKNEGLVYVATFTPAYLKAAAASDDDFVIARKGSGIYDSNAILDRNRDGEITVGDLKQHLAIQDHGSRWEEIATKIRTLTPAVAKAGTSVLALAGLGLIAWGAWTYFGRRSR